MSIYQCEECGCAENTSLGWYWYTEHIDPKYSKRKLCSACGPSHFSDGSENDGCGKWHGEFERIFYPKGSMMTDDNGNLVTKGIDDIWYIYTDVNEVGREPTLHEEDKKWDVKVIRYDAYKLLEAKLAKCIEQRDYIIKECTMISPSVIERFNKELDEVKV